ncbi:alpha/beta hydrolase [Actinomadura rudentiformis]|uniref:Alpha/beta hydrolase n=1 Tax=Actinomadura rudentiformis TaxID=359158 RepID=A0A6H9YQQ9_9ACTN|nr:alpha/beta hydrolase [Actinomadura rudentiformis]KAB2341606.1 alpha/beta hydrolase [Actinomadura rudentiformis]
MPSRTYELLANLFREAREAQLTAGRAELTEERNQHEALGDGYQPRAGVSDELIEGTVPGTRLMTPAGARDDLVIVFVHGGGFRTGSPRTIRQLGSQLALNARARVLLPKYRLAPEHPYPAALDDCESVYTHALSLVPGAKVVIGGESAGANLAAALLLRRRDAGDERVLAGFLYGGVFDLSLENYTAGSWVGNAGTDLALHPALGPIMTCDYLAGQRASDGYASPALCDLTGLPPLFLQVSSAECLLDDTLALTTAAARAGVHVELEVWPRMLHSWQAAAGFLPEATEAVERTAAFIQRVADGRIVDGAELSGGPASLDDIQQS